jgi:hypothetical protein
MIPHRAQKRESLIGALELRLPKSEAAKPRRIAIAS